MGGIFPIERMFAHRNADELATVRRGNLGVGRGVFGDAGGVGARHFAGEFTRGRPIGRVARPIDGLRGRGAGVEEVNGGTEEVLQVVLLAAHFDEKVMEGVGGGGGVVVFGDSAFELGDARAQIGHAREGRIKNLGWAGVGLAASKGEKGVGVKGGGFD